MRSGYQIDFLPVEKGGAAICVRYGVPGHYGLLVYDAGDEGAGEAMVRHIRSRYGTDVIDHLVCSHPCADDGAGTGVLLRVMQVRQLWMHRPWLHSVAVLSSLFPLAVQVSTMRSMFTRRLERYFLLSALAGECGTPMFEPFQGERIGPFTVMSPHRDAYRHRLMPQFEALVAPQGRATPTMAQLFKRVGAPHHGANPAPLNDTWEVEALREDVTDTGPENESCVVLFGLIGGQGILLTGDAGVQALASAAAFAQANRMALPRHLKFLQIPHYGDPNHVSPSTLDQLVGGRLEWPPQAPRLTAVAATPAGSAYYPSQLVVNALIRRGACVTATGGRLLRFSHHFGEGDSFEPFEAMPFLETDGI